MPFHRICHLLLINRAPFMLCIKMSIHVMKIQQYWNHRMLIICFLRRSVKKLCHGYHYMIKYKQDFVETRDICSTRNWNTDTYSHIKIILCIEYFSIIFRSCSYPCPPWKRYTKDVVVFLKTEIPIVITFTLHAL